MHLYFFIRGVNHQVEVFKTQAQSQFFKWKRTNLTTNKEEYVLVQGALRPSIFGSYEYVFPEEALAEVLAMFGFISTKHIGAEPNIKNFMRLALLRKIFGVKKIPKEEIEKAAKIPNTILVNDHERGLANCIVPGVSIHPIGIQKDKRGKLFNRYQELL